MKVLIVLALGAAVAFSPALGAAKDRDDDRSNGRLAFVLEADLFTIGASGGKRRQLTRGTALDHEPAWSPNGRWIAFSRTERRGKLTSVYVIPGTGGTPRLLVRGARSPSWSPTGRRLAVLRTKDSCLRRCPGARGVWTVPFPAGKARLASAAAWSSDWSRSGRELAVMEPDGVAIVTIPSGESRGISSLRGQPGAPLDWSPDDRSLVFVTGQGLVRVSVTDGSARTLVGSTPSSEPASCSGSVGPAKWSPDGRWIAYQEIRCVQESWSFLRSTIPIIDAEGVWQNQIENLIWGFTDDFGPHSFVWSPDSRFLAFIDDALGSEGEDFLEIAAVSPGGSYKRLAAGASGTPSWQPIVRR